MTKHVDIALDGAAPLTEAGCIAFLTALGYRVTAPSAPKRSPLRMDVITGYRPAMKSWEQQLVRFTFADGVKTFGYAMRETPKKGWLVGMAARVACFRYRDRRSHELVRYELVELRSWPEEALTRVGRMKHVEVVPGRYTRPIGPARVPLYRDIPVDTIAVPEIIAVEGLEIDLAALNAATAEHRAGIAR